MVTLLVSILKLVRMLKLASLFVVLCSFAASAEDTVPTDWPAFRLNPELNAVVGSDSDSSFSWTFKTGMGISSSPTVSGNTLFVASNDHHLYALDLTTGLLRWTYLARNEIMTAPLVSQGTVLIGEGDSYAVHYDPPNYALLGLGPNGVSGIDISTGKERWHHTLPGSAMPTGAVVDGVFEEHDSGGMLYAFSVEDGLFHWNQNVRSEAAMSAANNFRGTDVVTSGDYPNSVISFDGRTGEQNWRTNFAKDASGFADCPQASDGIKIYGMYLARPKDSPFNFVGYTTPGIEHAYALSGDDGKIAWDVPLVRGILPINNHAAIPLIYRNVMHLGSAIAPETFALDTRSGKLLWQLHVAGAVKGGMVASDGRLYFGDLGGYLWAVDAQSGVVIGNKKMPDGFNVGSPIIVGRTLVIGSVKGYVFAVPLDEIAASKDIH